MHTLTNINSDTRTATCGECGGTTIRFKGMQNGKPTWRCSSAGVERSARERYWRKRGIDITVAEYERRYVEQDGKCAICDEAFDSLHVDHDHATGEVRGLLCLGCNTALGSFDTPARLAAALAYLEGS